MKDDEAESDDAVPMKKPAARGGRGRGRGRGSDKSAKNTKAGRGRGGRGRGRGGGKSMVEQTPPRKPATGDEDQGSAPKGDRPVSMGRKAKMQKDSEHKPAGSVPAKKRKQNNDAEPEAEDMPEALANNNKPKAKVKAKAKTTTKVTKAKETHGKTSKCDTDSADKSFARRVCPSGERASNQWIAIRDTFDVHVKPYFAVPGKLEDFSHCMGVCAHGSCKYFSHKDAPCVEDPFWKVVKPKFQNEAVLEKLMQIAREMAAPFVKAQAEQ